MWLIVANIDNPIVTVPFTIQTVDIINEAYIEETGKTYLRDENQGSIRVYITGERKTVGRLSLDDIKAVAGDRSCNGSYYCYLSGDSVL